jgi:hypothetical protein
MTEDLAAHLSGESADSGPPCFWSYAREDDTRIGGKLTEVTEDIQHFYEFETGKSLPMFKDVETITWGQQWEQRVLHGLQNVMFLIPAVTPSFLRSQSCRNEILKFEAVCRARGVQNLILPIVFSGRHLLRIDSDDEVAQLLAKTQYVPFDEVWFTDRSGSLWMQTVHNMVLSLIATESAAEDQLSSALIRQATADLTSGGLDGAAYQQHEIRGPIDITLFDDGSEDGDPQLAELASTFEDNVERAVALLTDTFGKLGVVAEKIKTWGDERPNIGNARAANQYFFRIARDLDEPARTFYRTAAEAYNATLEADTTMRQIRQLAGELNEADVQDDFNATMAAAFADTSPLIEVVTGVNSVVPVIADAERYSALLKRALKPVRTGMQVLRDAVDILLAWAPAIGQPDRAGEAAP